MKFSIEQLAADERDRLVRAVIADRRKHRLSITVTRRDQPLPLSFAQQRLWFVAQMEGGSQAYHIPLGLRLHGELNEQALKRALDTVVARHESLRTSFAQEGERLVQRIAAVDIGFRLQEHDLSACSDTESEIQELATQEAVQAFDLQTGPLIRGRLIRLGEQRYVLLLTMHHIVSDGWSEDIFIQEFGQLYTAFSQGQPDPLPTLPIQYADYAVWQRQWLTGAVLQEQSDYWKMALAGVPALLELATDRPRPAEQDFTGGDVGATFDAELTAGLKNLSQQHGTTLFMTLLVGWAIVLSRLSGQEDLVIGTPVSGRGRAEVEPLIGFFVNTLALRIDLSGEPSVGELLQRVRVMFSDARRHQDLPFEQVVEIVQPPRNLAHNPVFQVTFAWQNYEEGHLELPELQLQSMAPARYMAKFDLSLSLGEAQGCIVGDLGYAASLFDEATVKRYVEYLYQILRQMVADESRSVHELQMLSEPERHKLLVEWNQTEAKYPEDKCIHDLFEEQAMTNSDAVALLHGEESLSYGELNGRANQLARHLRKVGVGPGWIVALCVERSPQMVVGLLAILKAGGAYVPLDPDYPSDRLQYMLEDSAVQVVLTYGELSAAVKQALNQGARDTLVLDMMADAPRWQDESGKNLAANEVGLTPEHLAYIIYTSGSTGRPKGVMLKHRPVVNLIDWVNRFMNVTPKDRIFFVTSLCFDLSVYDVFGTLAAGAMIDIAPSAVLKNPEELARYLLARPITFWDSAPTAFGYLASFLNAEKNAPARNSLRAIFLSGDWIPLSMPARARELFPHAQVIGLGGATEAAIWSNYFVIDVAQQYRSSIPYGKPIQNARYYILDRYLNPAPVGVKGDLYIGGECLANGYFGDAVKSAEKFLPDPYGVHSSARMYKTGDLARYLPDGNIEFMGRNDHQIKIRGFRIELGEIEARLAQHEAVSEVVVVVREDSPGDMRLVAYYCGVEGQEVGAGVLKRHVSAVLPEYMVPAAYVQLEAMPVTPNGKLDRKALPAPEGDAYASHAYEAPQGKMETALAEIWCGLLKLERVGRFDNFFALGGHSLLVTRLLVLIREELVTELSLKEIFIKPTLSQLAEAIVMYRLKSFTPDILQELYSGA